MAHNTAKSLRRHLDGIRTGDLRPKAAASSGGSFPVRHPGLRIAACFAFGMLAAAGMFAANSYVGATVTHEQGPASSHAGHLVRQPAALTNGLVAWYPLDGNAKDASGTGIDGTTFGSPAFVPGKFSKSIMLNGTSQYITAAKLNVTTAFTLSAWVNVSTLGNYYNVIFAGTSDNCNSNVVSLNVHYGFGEINMCNSDGTNTGQYARGGTAFSVGTWHLITGTFDGSTGLLSEYTDGVLIQSTNTGYSSIVLGRSAPITIGGGQYLFPGLIDDVRIYNRALSPAEVSRLYGGSQPANCDQYCTGWWKLDGTGSSTVAVDSAGSGNTGTLTNFTFDGTTNGWTGGVFSNALSFSKVKSTYITIPDAPNLDFTSAFSVFSWVNLPTVPPTGSNNDIVVKGQADVNPSYNYRLLFFDPTSQITYLTDGVTSLAGTEYYGVYQVDQSSFFGAWHHVGETYDGSTLRLYLDGRLVTSTPAPGPLKTYANPLIIGDNTGYASSAGLTGSIDDVRIYNRALKDYEVYDQYSAGRS